MKRISPGNKTVTITSKGSRKGKQIFEDQRDLEAVTEYETIFYQTNIRMFGDLGTMLSGSIEYHERKHGSPKPCPFCGCCEVHLQNTHTPSYWIECGNCEAQMGSTNESPSGNITTKKEFQNLHNASIISAISNWNRRDGCN